MNIKTFIAGILLGVVVVGAYWLVESKNSNAELFAKKERCSIYTQKRQIEANEKAELLGHSISVDGFYSPIANTCMTNSLEIAAGHYMQLILIDELTGKTEAFAFEAIGKDLADLSFGAKQEQVKQDINFQEKLRYFQGIK